MTYLICAVSQRGVVFFREQEIDLEEQKLLGTKLGELSGTHQGPCAFVFFMTDAEKGKPSSSTLHIHPLTAEKSEKGDHISIITSERLREYDIADTSKLASREWHSEYVMFSYPRSFG